MQTDLAVLRDGSFVPIGVQQRAQHVAIHLGVIDNQYVGWKLHVYNRGMIYFGFASFRNNLKSKIENPKLLQISSNLFQEVNRVERLGHIRVATRGKSFDVIAA